MIRVLLVDDSPVAVTILKRMLSKSPEIEVVGTAGNGLEALNLIPQVKPDVICTDLYMPVMDGIQFTREVMARYPLPILLVSVSGYKESINAFKVIEAGAIDIFLKPKAGFAPENERLSAELIMKVRILSKVHAFRRAKPGMVSGIGGMDVKAETSLSIRKSNGRIIVIGASTGGPLALQIVLCNLPADFSLPIICVQHISEGFLEGLVDWLSNQCKMKIEIAKAGTVPRSGTIYFPPEETHLKIDNMGRFVASLEPPFDGNRPSITVTMKSVVKYYVNSTLGVLLTGMGKDGAEGLLAIKKAGGMTIAQNETSSIVFGMPKEAIELGAATHIAALNEIGPMILNYALKLSDRC